LKRTRAVTRVNVLGDVVALIASTEQDATIYASEPWNAESRAVVAIELDSGRVPEVASPRGLEYVLEVAAARDFLEGWESTLDAAPTEHEKCARLIRHALDDA
jgi:hypothetical protein